MSEKLKKGDERVEITIVTKQDDFAEVSIDRLHKDIEVTPEDMRLAKRAFRHAYRDYVKARGKEVEESLKEEKEREKEEERKLSPHHQMIKEAIACGCLVELSLQEGSGVTVGFEPFTHRNGEVEDFHPSRFRIEGRDVNVNEPAKKYRKAVESGFIVGDGKPSQVYKNEVSGSMEVLKPSVAVLEENDLHGDGGEETKARKEASVLVSDNTLPLEKGKGGDGYES